MKLLLFGAGASIPFFKQPLTTTYITNEVMNKRIWETVLNEYWKISNEHIATPHQITKLIKTIKSNFYNSNFEDICEVLDKLALLNWPFDYEDKVVFKETIHSIIKCKVLKNGNKRNYYSYIIPFLYRCVILSIFLNAENNHSQTYKKMINKQMEFIKNYTKTDTKSSIVSLNYDDNLYQSIRKFFNTGFIEDEKFNNRNFFSVNEYFKANKTICFLHGNIRFWGYRFMNNTIESLSNRIQNIYNLKDEYTPYNSFSKSFNITLTTGRDKELTFNEHPYSAYYTKLAVDILDSEEIIIVGYSFNDEHINRLLKNFWSENRIKRIIIVDKIEGLIDSNHPENLNGVIDKIEQVFSTSLNYDNKEEFDKVNTEGYGYLFPKILFYKNGYEAFLNECDNVISCFDDSIYSNLY